jgi:two-component system phosphate regulon sensor histidine kinase PhoR
MDPRVVSPTVIRKVFGIAMAAALLIWGGGVVFGGQPPAVQVIGLAVLAALIWMLSVRLTTLILLPVTRLTEAAARIARGEVGVRAPAGSDDALGMLGRTLNNMADELERRVQDMESEGRQAQAILESMAEGVIALDREGRIRWLNASAQRLLGVAVAQASGKRIADLFRQPELEELVNEALAQGHAAAREVQAFAPGEQVVRFQATPCATTGAGGTALVLVAQDVTDVRRLERMRREFVANVSHELKTPLTSIKGLLETLLNGALEDPANNRRFVAIIDQDASRLGRLIDDLLELSQIESKASTLRLERVRLRPLLEAMVQTFLPQLEARQVSARLDVPADFPPVHADPDRLRQIFSNLIDNAIKFNVPNGTVTIQATQEEGSARIAVTDTGLGIPEADLPRVFERFYRVDKARSRELGGTGLGLAIVKHLVELHRGRVTVQSRPGQGSTFTVLLPISASPAKV